MGNRRQPFGYEIRLGKIQPHPIEAPVVKLIYIKYADGMSYLQITAMLNAGSVSYNEPDKPWNKNMVARILGNEIYVGAKRYPQLVDDDVFQQVREQKPETGQYKDADARTIRSLCKCAACGAKATLRSIACMMDTFIFDLLATVRTRKSSGRSISFSSQCFLISTQNS